MSTIQVSGNRCYPLLSNRLLPNEMTNKIHFRLATHTIWQNRITKFESYCSYRRIWAIIWSNDSIPFEISISYSIIECKVCHHDFLQISSRTANVCVCPWLFQLHWQSIIASNSWRCRWKCPTQFIQLMLKKNTNYKTD